MYPSESGATAFTASEATSTAASKASATASAADPDAARQPNAVFINVYDVMEGNSWLWSVGLGVHHAGVQVYDREYQYGLCLEGPGVGAVEPRHSPMNIFREQFFVGQTQLSEAAVQELVEGFRQRDTWLGNKYHLLRHNCLTFAHAFCEALLPPDVRVAQLRDMPATAYQSPYTEEVEVDGRRYAVPVLIPPHVDRLCNYAVAYLPGSAVEKLNALNRPG